MKTLGYRGAVQALASGAAGSLLVLLGVVALRATATPQTDTVPRQIPYSGTLEFDGRGVTLLGEDAIFLRFDILDEDEDGQLAVVYSQTLQTEVFGGEFTAYLGPQDDSGLVGIEEVAANADSLYLQVVVLGTRDAQGSYGYHEPGDPESSSGDDVVLSNPQRLLMSPFSLWATRATNFEVTGGVTVGGRLEVSGGGEQGITLEDGALTASGDVTLGSDSSNVSLGLLEGQALKLQGLSALSVVPGQDAVAFNPDGDFAGLRSQGTTVSTGATTVEQGGAHFTGQDFSSSLGANSGGVHGFRFGDTDATSLQVGYDTEADSFVIEDTNGADRFVLPRGGGSAVIHDDLQVNGSLGFNGMTGAGDMTVFAEQITVQGDLRLGGRMYMPGLDPFDTDDDAISNNWPSGTEDFVSNPTTVTAFNSGGVNTGLERTTRGFCVLTGIKLSEMSSDSDVSGCTIDLQSNYWRLRAISRGSGASCQAHCFNWETEHF